MTTLNTLGIAPRLHYANAEQGIAITDFVASQPPSLGRRPPATAAPVGGLGAHPAQGPALPRGDSIFDKADPCRLATTRSRPTIW
ncbi:MAG: hypothetical protein R2867_20450 [Caldilineaceae bacterium]